MKHSNDLDRVGRRRRRGWRRRQRRRMPEGASAASLPTSSAGAARDRPAVAAMEGAGAAARYKHGGVVVAAKGVAVHVVLLDAVIDAEWPAHGGVRGAPKDSRRAIRGRAESEVEHSPLDYDGRVCVHWPCVPSAPACTQLLFWSGPAARRTPTMYWSVGTSTVQDYCRNFYIQVRIPVFTGAFRTTERQT